MRPTFPTHPKINRVAHVLQIPLAHAIGLCECLWAVAYDSGEPIIGDETDIELAAKWTGAPGALAKALLECGGPQRHGLIDRGEDGRLAIHDFFHHCPDYVSKRAQREAERAARGVTISDLRRRAAQARWGAAKSSDAPAIQADANGGQMHEIDEEHHSDGAPKLARGANETSKNANVVQPDANGGQMHVAGCKRHANGEPPAPAPNKRDRALAVPSKRGSGPTGFQRFWAAYPNSRNRKKGRSKCLRLWKDRNLEEIADIVLKGLEAAKRSKSWKDDGGAFIPGPQPWLNDESWEAFLSSSPDGGENETSEEAAARALFGGAA